MAAPGTVGGVEVTSGEDSSERPVYYFSFFIDQERARLRAGLVRARSIQKPCDDPLARGDGHYPILQILNKEDWAARANAKSI